MSDDDAPSEAVPDPTPRAILVRNERVKLTATWIDGLAVAVFAVGGFAPLVTAVIAPAADAPGARLTEPGLLAVMGICWIVSGSLHFSARWSLKELGA